MNVTINVVTPYCKDSVQRSVKVDDNNLPEENADKTITLITVNPVNKLIITRV
jgi:hypothetical protein